MATKPNKIVDWANNDTVETRQGGNNKLEPTDNLKNNGSLDGSYSLNHLNFMFNVLGLWSKFTNDMIEVVNGTGTGLTKDEHFSFIFAFDSTNLSNYVLGFADKPTSAAASTKIINNNTLTFGTANADGTIPISGVTATNIKAFSINFKIS
jgi:hypothetical protein